jgi:hypothetical protein
VQYYAGHEFFLDEVKAVFVIVVSLTDPEKSRRLAYWLLFIKNRMSEQISESKQDGFKPTIVLVGSQRDKPGSQARKDADGWTSDWGTLELGRVSVWGLCVCLSVCLSVCLCLSVLSVCLSVCLVCPVLSVLSCLS